MKVNALTDIGKVKTNNEDLYYYDIEHGLFMVSDGMGGHNSGEVASKEVVESFKQEVLEKENYELFDVYRKTNNKIIKMGESDPKYHKMGATLVLLKKNRKNVEVFNLGDSRVYRIFKKKNKWLIEQITKDHTRVSELVAEGKMNEEEAENHPWKHILSKYFGNTKTNNEPDIKTIIFKKNEFYLLCTDGLSNAVSDKDILYEIRKKGVDAVSSLIDKANENGGEDNITAMIVQVEKKDLKKDYFPTFNKLFRMFKKKNKQSKFGGDRCSNY